MAGHSVSMQKRSHRLGRIPCSVVITVRTAAESDTSARRPSADARVISRSSLNVIPWDCRSDYWAGRQSGGLCGAGSCRDGRRGGAGNGERIGSVGAQ